MKTPQRKVKAKAVKYGEHYNASKHFAAGAILRNAIANGLRGGAKFAPATLMLH